MSVSIAHLHDLAVLYLGLAYGADADLDSAEMQEIVARLYKWQPNRDPAMLQHVLREASMTYFNNPSRERLETIIETLGEALDPDTRAAILEDLLGIAKADGEVVALERDYISHLRRIWGGETPQGDAS
jgi:uncharacterized tellurite resistance protein B-like protein